MTLSFPCNKYRQTYRPHLFLYPSSIQSPKIIIFVQELTKSLFYRNISYFNTDSDFIFLFFVSNNLDLYCILLVLQDWKSIQTFSHLKNLFKVIETLFYKPRSKSSPRSNFISGLTICVSTLCHLCLIIHNFFLFSNISTSLEFVSPLHLVGL